WHVIPDRIRGLRRRAAPLPPALPDPPAAGTCAVQLLRTYPRRHPRYPYAPRGERSIALAYTKAIGRAEQLIYVGDQYLWSFDVARIFAAALQRSARLHLIAVVPRRPDTRISSTSSRRCWDTPRPWPWCGRRAGTGFRCSMSRTCRAVPFTSIPSCASSTMSGRRSVATTSTARAPPSSTRGMAVAATDPT